MQSSSSSSFGSSFDFILQARDLTREEFFETYWQNQPILFPQTISVRDVSQRLNVDHYNNNKKEEEEKGQPPAPELQTEDDPNMRATKTGEQTVVSSESTTHNFNNYNHNDLSRENPLQFLIQNGWSILLQLLEECH